MHGVKYVVLLLAAAMLLWGCATEPPAKQALSANTDVAREPEMEGQTHEAQDQPAAVSTSTNINVTISMRPELLPNGRVQICGETNLPQGTELMVSLQEKGSLGLYQSKCSVADGGKFCSESFGRKDAGLPKGVYVADVVMPLARYQSPDVRKIIGENGERLSGPLVKRNALGVFVQKLDGLTVAGDSATTVQGQQPVNSQKALPREEVDTLEEYKQKVLALPFSLEQQKKIFAELVLANDRARDEAIEAVGLDASMKPESFELEEKLKQKYWDDVCRRNRLELDQARTIHMRGNIEAWPLPAH